MRVVNISVDKQALRPLSGACARSGARRAGTLPVSAWPMRVDAAVRRAVGTAVKPFEKAPYRLRQRLVSAYMLANHGVAAGLGQRGCAGSSPIGGSGSQDTSECQLAGDALR